LKYYCKGKPISDNSSRVLPSDIFICEFRVDKTARTFSRLAKTKQFGINTKSYCFDSYVEPQLIKRDYQPYQKEIQQQQQHYHHHDTRRRPAGNLTKLNNKKLQEKRTRINGFIEKIYRRFHDQHLKPNDTKCTIDQLLQQSSTPSILIDENSSHVKENILSTSPLVSSPSQSPAGNINQKRRTISLSSDDDIVELIRENDCERIPKKRSTKQIIYSPCKRDELID